MLIRETWLNRTENYICGDSGLYEPFTDNIKTLFREFQKEFGRCISKIYIDKKDKAIAIGYVFLKKAKYEDIKEVYIQETWIEFHIKEPTVKTRYYYREI